MIEIDGLIWDVPCDLTRTAEITQSDISGLMMDRAYYNDVIGTFLTYDVVLAVPIDRMADYDALYEVLTDPVPDHTFVMPYGQSVVTLVARVESVKDVYVYVSDVRQYWKGVTFTVISNYPTKVARMDGITVYGRTAAPDMMGIPDGTLLLMDHGAWVIAGEYENADEKRY